MSRGVTRPAKHSACDSRRKTRDLTATIETLQAEVVERMVAENDLRESNARFEQLAATISDVFWLMDITNMRLLYISPAYESVWGRPCSTMYNDPHSWLDAVHPDDHERALTFFDQETRESRYDAEYRIVRPDGECGTFGTAAISSAMKMDGLRGLPASPAISPRRNGSRKNFKKLKNGAGTGLT